MSKIKLFSNSLSLFTILIISMLQFVTIVGQSDNLKIHEVENNLLPVVLIEGEKPFNIEERMKYHKVPGISVAVIKDFKVEWYKHYGVMDAELNNPVTDETIFNVGSLSKGVSALTILSLANDGKIDLYKDVNQQLISWKIPENEFTQKGNCNTFSIDESYRGNNVQPSIFLSAG